MDGIAEQTISLLRSNRREISILVTLHCNLSRKDSPLSVATKRALTFPHFKEIAFGSAVVWCMEMHYCIEW